VAGEPERRRPRTLQDVGPAPLSLSSFALCYTCNGHSRMLLHLSLKFRRETGAANGLRKYLYLPEGPTRIDSLNRGIDAVFSAKVVYGLSTDRYCVVVVDDRVPAQVIRDWGVRRRTCICEQARRRVQGVSTIRRHWAEQRPRR
jgi:hypothetical protein